jgi:(2Fe-2S) ferredoxin
MSSVFVAESDCTGQCSSGPTVRVTPEQSWYCRVTPEDVTTIVDQHLMGDRPVESLLHPRFHPRADSFLPTPDADAASEEPSARNTAPVHLESAE